MSVRISAGEGRLMGTLLIRSSWRPQPKQRQFLLDDRSHVAAFIGGFGSGKTTVGARKAFALACLNPGCDGMILAPTNRLLKARTWREFRAVVPEACVRKENRGERYLELVNGARVYYWSADGKAKLDGPDLAWIWIDELRLVPRQQYLAALARVRDPRAHQRQVIVTSTGAYGYMYDEFGPENLQPGRSVIHVSTRENTALDPGFVRDLELSFDAHTAAMGIEGRWAAVAGVVYQEFDPLLHVVDWAPVVGAQGADTVCGVDFGQLRAALVFLQPYRLDGSWCVVDEIMMDNGSAAEMAAEARKRGFKITRMCLDPASTMDERAAMRLLGPVHIPDDGDDREQRLGLGRVKAGLRDHAGRTRLFFARRLRQIESSWKRGVLKDIVRYRWPEKTTGPAMGRGYIKPLRDGISEHSMDAIRYASQNLFPPSARFRSSYYAT